jgi:hypothetical protein
VKDYSIKNTQLTGTNTETQFYEHLIDGGPYDNLGITSLINILQKRKQKIPCLLLAIDAYPYPVSANHVHQADTRNAADYLFDAGTVLASTDVMLAKNRTLVLEKAIGFDAQDIGFKAYSDNSKKRTSSSDSKNPICTVWHLSFQRLYDLQFEWTFARRDVNRLQFLDRVRRVVNSIPTRYRLEESQEGDTPEAVQDYIFKAAKILVREDKECNRDDNECTDDTVKFTYQKVCDLLVNHWGLKDIESRCR